MCWTSPSHSFEHGLGEHPFAKEDAGILGEETEDEPRHEMVHVVATFGLTPIGIVLQEFDVDTIEPTGRPDVERVLADLRTVVMPASGKKKPKWSGKSLNVAGDGLAAGQVFGLEVRAIGGEDELCLGPSGGRG